MRVAVRFLVGYVFISGFAIAFALISLSPHIPKTIVGWLLLLALAPPVYVILEVLGSVMLSDSLITRLFGAAGGSSSVVRIAYGVALFSVLAGAIFLAALQAPESIREFLANQFW